MSRKANRRPAKVEPNRRPEVLPETAPRGPGSGPGGSLTDLDLASFITGMLHGVRDGLYTPSVMNAAMGGVRAMIDFARLYHKHGRAMPYGAVPGQESRAA